MAEGIWDLQHFVRKIPDGRIPVPSTGVNRLWPRSSVDLLHLALVLATSALSTHGPARPVSTLHAMIYAATPCTVETSGSRAWTPGRKTSLRRVKRRPVVIHHGHPHRSLIQTQLEAGASLHRRSHFLPRMRLDSPATRLRREDDFHVEEEPF